jgi:hypothetical protein
LIPARRLLHQIAKQEFIDLPQPRDPQTSTELIQHSHVGQITLVGQMREGSPLALFGQAIQQQIEGMHRREQRQQMQPPELGGAELTPRATGGPETPSPVDEIIRNVGIEQIQ